MTETVLADAPRGVDDIPAVPGLPFVGSLRSILRDPVKFFVDSYHQHGSVYRVRMPGRSFVVLAGEDLARFMGSREGQAVLSTRDTWVGMDREYGAQHSLVSSDGEVHRKLRAIMRQGYAREVLDGRVAEFLGLADRHVQADWQLGQTVSVKPLLQRLVVDQIGTIINGQGPGEYLDDVRRVIRTILNVHVVKVWPQWAMYNPSYLRSRARVLRLARGLQKSASEELLVTAAADSKHDGGYGPNPGSADNFEPLPHAVLLRDLVVANMERPELLNDEDLLLALTGPYIAGMDTVASVVGSTLHLLLAHPEALAQVRAEGDELFQAVHDGGDLDLRVLERMPATYSAVRESMRLYPVAVAQPRTAVEEFTYGGYTIPAGTTVYCAVGVSHYRADFFPEPERFDIGRYGDERREHTVPGAYSPYGRGPHTCLGKGFADVAASLTIAWLVHRLDLALMHDGPMERTSLPTPGPSTAFRVKVNGLRYPALG